MYIFVNMQQIYEAGQVVDNAQGLLDCCPYNKCLGLTYNPLSEEQPEQKESGLLEF